MSTSRPPEHDLESLTMGTSLRLQDLVSRDSLNEMVRSFFALFGIPIRILTSDGVLIADAVRDQHICQYVNGFHAGASACAQTVNGARRAEPAEGTDVSHPCFTGATYRIVPIDYDSRRLGKIIIGPYLPTERTELPRSLLTVDARIDAQRARELLPRMPRAKAETITLVAAHLQCALDLIMFSGHKALLTSQMHLATVRESYRELQEKAKKLQDAYDRLKELDRLKSNFLGTVSHELRTPLTSIIGYSEMLAEGIAGPLQGEQQEFVKTIHEKGEQLLSLIMGLLDMSKLESGTLSLRKSLVDVGQVLGEVASTALPNARKRGVLIESSVAPGLPKLHADGERLRQVFLNLTDNAVKFSPRGARVRLVARAAVAEAADDDEGGIALLAPSRRVVEVSVVDEGIGIAEAERARIFDPFYQSDSSSTREYGGTGLGLSIVRRLVEAHGGSIEVKSNVPAGSIFVVRLPIDA